MAPCAQSSSGKTGDCAFGNSSPIAIDIPGRPAPWEADAGISELVRSPHAMMDWCRFTGVGAAFIDPASPRQDGICESFNGRLRDELLACEQFCSLTEARLLAEDWRIEYNFYRPPGSPGSRTPEAFRQQWTTGRVQPIAIRIAGGPVTGARVSGHAQ